MLRIVRRIDPHALAPGIFMNLRIHRAVVSGNKNQLLTMDIAALVAPRVELDRTIFRPTGNGFRDIGTDHCNLSPGFEQTGDFLLRHGSTADPQADAAVP